MQKKRKAENDAKETRISAVVPSDCHRLDKAASGLTGIPMQEIWKAMHLYFWGFEDPEVEQQRKKILPIIQALTNGERPFDCGVVVALAMAQQLVSTIALSRKK